MEITASFKLTDKLTLVYDKKSDKNYITSDFKTFEPLSEKQIQKITKSLEK
jgi:hypothetical protein